MLRLIGISRSALVGMDKTWGRKDFTALFEILEGIGWGICLYGDPGVGDDGRHVERVGGEFMSAVACKVVVRRLYNFAGKL